MLSSGFRLSAWSRQQVQPSRLLRNAALFHELSFFRPYSSKASEHHHRGHHLRRLRHGLPDLTRRPFMSPYTSLSGDEPWFPITDFPQLTSQLRRDFWPAPASFQQIMQSSVGFAACRSVRRFESPSRQILKRITSGSPICGE